MSAASDRLMTMGAAAIYGMLADDAPTTAAIADEVKRLGVPGDEVGPLVQHVGRRYLGERTA